MNDTILSKIIEARRLSVERLKSALDLTAFYDRAHQAATGRLPHRMLDELSVADRINIIAEFKRASPSKGIINQTVEPSDAASRYQRGGAAAISVLTEEDFFRGSLDDLGDVRRAVELPVLRKDFVVDEFQIYESILTGADAVLLIVAALEKAQIRKFLDLAAILKLDVIVEVHNIEEMTVAAELGTKIIGVNNRDLKTFAVSLDISRSLIKQKPEGAIMIAESGLNTAEEVAELRALGYSAFLIGETLMRSGDPVSVLRNLTTRGNGDERSSAPAATEGLS